MALELMTGLEFGVLEENISASGSSPVSSSYKRSGTYSLTLSSYSGDFNNTVNIPFPSALSECYFQFALLIGTTSNSITRPILAWRKGSTVLGGIKLNKDTNFLEVYTGNFSTLVSTGNIAINQAWTFFVIEVYVKIADSGGVITVRVNGIQSSTFTGDTKPGTDTDIDSFMFGNLNNAVTYWDDIILNSVSGSINNSWPGGAKIVLLKPSSDGSTKNWTPSTGTTHYTLVDEVPPSATDNLQSDAAAEVEELGLEDLPAEATAVSGVKLQMYGLRGSTGTPTQVKLGVRIGSTNYMSSAKDVGIAQTGIKHFLETDPSDSNAWTVSDVNNMQLVLESA